jgi:hypothetical protein
MRGLAMLSARLALCIEPLATVCPVARNVRQPFRESGVESRNPQHADDWRPPNGMHGL